METQAQGMKQKLIDVARVLRWRTTLERQQWRQVSLEFLVKEGSHRVYLQRRLRVRVQDVAAALGGDALPALAEHDVDLHVHQQGDDEGDIEGDNGGIHDEGRIGNDALLLIWKTEGFGLAASAVGSAPTSPSSIRGRPEWKEHSTPQSQVDANSQLQVAQLTCLVEAKQDWAGDGKREHPDHGDHDGDPALGAVAGVVQHWHRYGCVPAEGGHRPALFCKCCPGFVAAEPSPVNADGTEVEDTGSAHHDIEGDEDITVDPTEPPLPNHLQRERTQCRKSPRSAMEGSDRIRHQLYIPSNTSCSY